MASFYHINKGVGKPVEFKGLKAQYIWYLGGGLVALLIVFAVLYICAVNVLICLGIIVVLGSALFMYVYHLSNKYGEHGLMKKVASSKVPKVIKMNSKIKLLKTLRHD